LGEHGSEPAGDVTGWVNVTVSGRSMQPAVSFMREFAAV
jgi:hypothetical protein